MHYILRHFLCRIADAIRAAGAEAKVHAWGGSGTGKTTQSAQQALRQSGTSNILLTANRTQSAQQALRQRSRLSSLQLPAPDAIRAAGAEAKHGIEGSMLSKTETQSAQRASTFSNHDTKAAIRSDGCLFACRYDLYTSVNI